MVISHVIFEISYSIYIRKPPYNAVQSSDDPRNSLKMSEMFGRYLEIVPSVRMVCKNVRKSFSRLWPISEGFWWTSTTLQIPRMVFGIHCVPSH